MFSEARGGGWRGACRDELGSDTLSLPPTAPSLSALPSKRHDRRPRRISDAYATRRAERLFGRGSGTTAREPASAMTAPPRQGACRRVATRKQLAITASLLDQASCKRHDEAGERDRDARSRL